jgi:hypothetical protein
MRWHSAPSARLQQTLMQQTPMQQTLMQQTLSGRPRLEPKHDSAYASASNDPCSIPARSSAVHSARTPEVQKHLAPRLGAQKREARRPKPGAQKPAEPKSAAQTQPRSTRPNPSAERSMATRALHRLDP